MSAPIAGPVIFFAGLATGVTGISIGAVRRLTRLINSKYGKGICLIGPEGSGKTTLRNALVGTNDQMETAIPMWHGPERVKQFGGPSLRMKSLGDLPGRQYAYGDWEHAVTETDITLYLVDITRMKDDTYRERVHNDARLVGVWFGEGGVGHNKPLVVVATHADHDPRYSRGRPAQYTAAISKDLDEAMVLMGAGAVGHTFAVLGPDDVLARRESVARVINVILSKSR